MADPNSTANNLLDAYRQARAPDASQLDRALQGVHARVDAADFPPSELEAPIPDPVRPGLMSSVTAKVAAAGLAVATPLVLWGVFGSGGEAPAAPPSAPVVSAVKALPVQPNSTAPAPIPVPGEEAAQDRDRPLPTARPASRSKRRPKVGNEPAPSLGGIDAEMRLLGEASVALKKGRANRALQLVEKHARTFPKSTLAETREVTRTLALAALGRDADACQARDRFIRRWPGSPYRHRVEKSCKSTSGK